MHNRGVIAVALTVLLSAAIVQYGCSSSSEQRGGDGQAGTALKARLVYYAIPG